MSVSNGIRYIFGAHDHVAKSFTVEVKLHEMQPSRKFVARKCVVDKRNSGFGSPTEFAREMFGETIDKASTPNSFLYGYERDSIPDQVFAELRRRWCFQLGIASVLRQ